MKESYAVTVLCDLAWFLAGIVCLPLFGAGSLASAVFFGAPCCYFITNPKMYGAIKDTLYEMYREKGLRLTGTVAKRWTTTSEKGGTSHFISAIYHQNNHLGDEQRYIRHLQVSATGYSQTSLNLVILPQYPKSAILLAQAEKMDIWGESPVWPELGIGGSFVWTCVWNVVFVHNVLNPMWKDVYLVWASVACEVIFAWTIGYFMVRAFVNRDLRNTLFRANIIDSSNIDIIHKARMPKITYQEMFPSRRITLGRIVWMIITDFAKFLGFVLLFVYGLVFGGGYLLMKPFFIDRKIKQLFAEYKAQGTLIRGRVIHRTVGAVKVQYDVADGSLSSTTAQRYEKTFIIPRYNKHHYHEPPTISDNPCLIFLKDVPTSAHLVDEINNSEKLYGAGCGMMIAIIILFACQTAYECFVVGSLAFPDIPTWVFALICVALQLGLGSIGAFLHSRYVLSNVLHGDAKTISVKKNTVVDKGGDIELATLQLNNSDGFTDTTDSISLNSTEEDWTPSDCAAMERTID